MIIEKVNKAKRRPRVGGDPDPRLIPTSLCKGAEHMPGLPAIARSATAGSPPTRGRRASSYACISQPLNPELCTRLARQPGRHSRIAIYA